MTNSPKPIFQKPQDVFPLRNGADAIALPYRGALDPWNGQS